MWNRTSEPGTKLCFLLKFGLFRKINMKHSSFLIQFELKFFIKVDYLVENFVSFQNLLSELLCDNYIMFYCTKRKNRFFMRYGRVVSGLPIYSPVEIRFNLEVIATVEFLALTCLLGPSDEHIKSLQLLDTGKVVNLHNFKMAAVHSRRVKIRNILSIVEPWKFEGM